MLKLSDLYLLSPELTLTLVALVVMAVDLFTKRRIVVVATALIGLIVPIALTISQIFVLDFSHANHAFFNMLSVDSYAVFFKVVFLLIAVVMILASYEYVKKYVKSDGEFYTLMLFSVVGMMLMASTTELITIYISLELTSIPLYVMAGLIRSNEKSAEAAVKYVLLGAMSSAILLYGFALLYGLTGTTDLMGIATLIKSGIHVSTGFNAGDAIISLQGNLMELVAGVLILAGFGFKISAVPFHMWAPDIYEGAPTPATAFFSVGSKAAGFAALIRVFIDGGLGQVNLTSLVVMISIVAILTMTLGNFVAAVQTNVKRMMAYSSIAQAGYILVGFVASFASGRSDGNAAVLFFILIYVVTNLGAFSGIIALGDLTGGDRIEDFRGLAKRSPLLAAGTAACLASLAGIPPLAGFWSKVIIFSTAWGLGLNWLVIIALLNSVVSLVYYGRIIKSMYFDAPLKQDRLTTPISLATSITFAAAALIILTVAAQFIINAATPAASSLLAFLLGR
ncbi:MAG: NADH-quinone oxidoreductase subunit N [Ktedonobacteraceae bacterium]